MPDDPDEPFEPTDEELATLMREAFAHIPEQTRRIQAEMEARIAARRIEVLARLAARKPG